MKMADNPKNWASYENLLPLAAGQVIESPAGSPLPYIAGLSRDKRKAVDELFGLKTSVPVDKEGFFYSFNRLPPEGEETRTRDFIKNSGWKFHISVHPDDVPLAWNSIVDYLQQEGVASAKVASAITAREHHLLTDPDSGKKNPQAGKMIVLYAAETIAGQDAHSAGDWQRIINGVEERLAKVGVRPGHEVITDKPVKGSMYSYYRSDRITKLMEKAFKEMKEGNTDQLIEHFIRNAKTIMGPAYKADYDAAYDAALDAFVDKPPPTLSVLLEQEKCKEIAMKHLDPAQTGLTEADIAALLPKITAELQQSRLSLIELPPEKRYKLPVEEDRFATLHIESPHQLQALQRQGEKGRGINQKGG
jgi:hypothetical protein